MAESAIEGKTALVTGAAKGLGRAISLRLAEKGVRLALNYKSSGDQAQEVARAIKKKGGEAIAIQADVSNASQVTALVNQVEEEMGTVDILVNNAGIINDGLLVRMSDDAWHNVIDTNLNGTFYCSRACLRGMLRSRWGRIVNVGSVVGIRGNAGQVNYSASKAAIIGFTKALAKEVAVRNITVNAVTPGYVETDTTAILSDEQKEYWQSVIPQGHFGEADDIAHMVAFLADEKAKYITGQIISVDGGMAV